jgi:hypothetical protein
MCLSGKWSGVYDLDLFQNGDKDFKYLFVNTMTSTWHIEESNKHIMPIEWAIKP